MSEFNLVALATAPQQEAARQMSICNACRYCEGLCAVFQAMEKRRAFDGADVDYLSNLCHNCGACYYACQYAPPHEFAINVPTAMAQVREESYARHVWPRAFAGVFEHNARWIGGLTLAAVLAFVVGLAAGPVTLFARQTGDGAFYRYVPHGVLVAIFGVVLIAAIWAMAQSVRRFWQSSATNGHVAPGAIGRALHDAATLRYLDGGGAGCMNDSERPDDRRRLFHHATSYGFLLCLASTSLATVCHYLGYEAPYPVWHPVVLLGVLGGLGLVIGPTGLLVARFRRAQPIAWAHRLDMGAVFIVMLLATSVSGLALLAMRATPVMGLLLAIHLGIVLGLFISLPYGKFVHGLHRVAALVRHAHEQSATTGG